mmetsp:Transcript_52505/g.152623  ORF Transcript_52505/g.152623 Transcript_52505/m.152623 type:complete len:275 (+) Transcript_52505:124-948(+)
MRTRRGCLRGGSRRALLLLLRARQRRLRPRRLRPRRRLRGRPDLGLGDPRPRPRPLLLRGLPLPPRLQQAPLQRRHLLLHERHCVVSLLDAAVDRGVDALQSCQLVGEVTPKIRKALLRFLEGVCQLQDLRCCLISFPQGSEVGHDIATTLVCRFVRYVKLCQERAEERKLVVGLAAASRLLDRLFLDLNLADQLLRLAPLLPFTLLLQPCLEDVPHPEVCPRTCYDGLERHPQSRARHTASRIAQLCCSIVPPGQAVDGSEFRLVEDAIGAII